jgi:hypothetical protein
VANNSTVDIDFDGAGGAEFAITHASGVTTKTIGSKISTKPFNRLGMANGTGATSLGVVGLPKPARLGNGVTVSSLSPFTPFSAFQPSNLAGGFGGGAWNGGQTGFIGVRFNLGGGPLYGWIQLQTPAPGLSGSTGQILGYAYENSGGAITTPASAVPEPNTLLLLASGALGVLALKRRKRG